MARPTARRAETDQPAAPAPDLQPAPDNGVPYARGAGSTGATSAGTGRDETSWGRKLGHRIPNDLYDDLTARSEQTGIPVGTLVTRALRAESRGLVIPEDLADRIMATTGDSRAAERLVTTAVEAELNRRKA